MAEVGLLPFARSALEVSKGVLPRHRSRCGNPNSRSHSCLAFSADVLRGLELSAKPRYVWPSIANRVRLCGLPACPISRLCTAFCNAWTIGPSTKQSARPCAGCVALAEKADDELA
jgi:hypothetical protein